MFRWLARKIRGITSLLFPGTAPPGPPPRESKSEPPVTFPAISVVDKPPRNEEVEPGHLYCVLSGNKPKWALFQCPCACGTVITLSLQPVHNPHWRLSKTVPGRPTLHPSVWRDKGCLSHFWLRDGRVSWCFDTGNHPESRYAGMRDQID